MHFPFTIGHGVVQGSSYRKIRVPVAVQVTGRGCGDAEERVRHRIVMARIRFIG